MRNELARVITIEVAMIVTMERMVTVRRQGDRAVSLCDMLSAVVRAVVLVFRCHLFLFLVPPLPFLS